MELRRGGVWERAPASQLNRSKRQRILVGILEAVGSEGYEATSVRSVLDRTGLYRQAFYDSFTSKDDCFAQAFEERLGELEEEVRAAADSDEWAERLRLGLIAILDFLDAEPLVGRALVVEVHAAGGRPVQLRTAAFGRASEFLGTRARAWRRTERVRRRSHPRRSPPASTPSSTRDWRRAGATASGRCWGS